MADEREPAFHLIEPARIGGREMEVEARMAGEPGLDPRMFVSGVVIGDQVRVKFGGNVVIEVVEKGQKLLVPVARSECGKLRERAIEPNCSLSAALTVTTVLGLPIGQYHTGLAS